MNREAFLPSALLSIWLLLLCVFAGVVLRQAQPAFGVTGGLRIQNNWFEIGDPEHVINIGGSGMIVRDSYFESPAPAPKLGADELEALETETDLDL